eukprot:CAMPEP_0172727092 /NCGR_PEP_ID=MMETSP1074-20121228/91485_1 /TAXON_ID=2916 /ORGANISM="Ceratium fusus, Strain PA161109" /LENGTH=297 /DNA_ID=CAMNT_0013554207 /DNA_START=47 /DNA_END=940 /DNA_ORIENTATION=-
MRVQITGEDKDDLQERGVTFYHISVSDVASGIQWDVRKRYNDFRKLDRKLRCNGELSPIDLPSKGLMGFRHRLNIGDFNEQRLTGLRTYLDHLTTWQTESQMNCPALFDFLEGSARGVHLPTTNNVVAHKSYTSELPVRVVSPDADIMQWSAEPGLHGMPEQRSKLCPGTNRDVDFLSSQEWLNFEASHPAVANSVERCARLLEGKQFENDSEESFSALRRSLLAALRPRTGSGPPLVLEVVPGKAVVWEFLLLIRARRPFYRNQADEIISILEENGPWAEALDEHEELRLRRARFA